MTRSVAVVTGAASGIGAAISRELASRGFTVVPTDLDEGLLALTAEACAAPASYVLDVRDVESVCSTTRRIVENHGAPTVWVSNAGVSKMRPFLEITPDELDLTLGVNLRGVFLTSQAAARAMVEAGSGGCIVNIASMASKQGRVPFLSDYVASKFGVVGLTQAMAVELAEHSIRVNSVCPGYVATPMQDRELAWEAELRGTTVDAVRKLYLADTPMARLEQPEDVARVVAFLVSADAEFVTGESIAVNGGAFMD
ncbi:MAG: SDR family NAD(P)-dependent oxidoreductase [Acidimicrobiales bacterium]|jgi:NAD(P)-dependent dehydrogenase (short-subunit alcohol dehydrogenase family)